LALAITEGSQGRGRAGIDESFDEISGRSGGFFSGGRSRHGDMGGIPGEGICYSFGCGLSDPDSVAPIMQKSWADIPSVDCMGSPGGSGVRFLVD
jgi:hypothetical protein